MRSWIIFILATTLVAFGCPEWLSGNAVPYLVRSAVYPLFHTNIFHLAVNCIAIWSVFNPRRKDNAKYLAVGYLISIMVYGCSFKPMVGFSNILYAVLGSRTPALSSSWWKTAPVITFIVVTLAMAFIPSISAVSHIAAFIVGMAVAEVARRLNALDYDVDRARGR